MTQTIEATIDETGQVYLLQPLNIKGVHRALVTIFDEPLQEVKAQREKNCMETTNELFGIWQDRDDLICVDDYVRSLRKERY